MKKTLFLLLSFFFISLVTHAQKVYYWNQLQSIKTDDGRTQYIDRETDKPLKGECKVISSIRDRDDFYLTKYKDGFKDGEDIRYKRGVKNVQAYYKQGILNGTFKQFYSGGALEREVNFVNGKMEGLETKYYVDGTIESVIGYKNGLNHGQELKLEYQTRDTLINRNYIDGKLEGYQRRRISSNLGEFQERSYYQDGKLVEYRDYFYPNGPLHRIKENGKELNYKNGQLFGEQKYYHLNGILERVSTYVDGYKQGAVKEYYADGVLKLEENYRKNELYGLCVEYHPNGQKKSEWTMEGRYRNGPYKIYYEDGQLMEEGEVKENLRIYQKTYYKNGQLKSHHAVSSGVWTEIEKYDEEGKQL